MPAGRRLLLALLAGLLGLLAPSPAAPAPDKTPRLANFYADWLSSVDHLIGDAERQAFGELTDDLHRELFIRRFWSVRAGLDSGLDPELPARHARQTAEARRRFRDLSSARARAFLIAGGPARTAGFGGCRGPVRRLEIWSYDRAQAARLADAEEGFNLVFYEPTSRRPGHFLHWSPDDGFEALMSTPPGSKHASGAPATLGELMSAGLAEPCGASTFGEAQRVRRALEQAWGPAKLSRRAAPAAIDPGWLEAFRAGLADRPQLPAAPVEITFPGHQRLDTIVRGRVRVPLAEIEKNADGHLFDRLTISGDVWRGERLVEPFHVVVHVAGPPPPGGAVILDLYRRLRRGTYVLDLRVTGGRGLPLLRQKRTIEVPWVDAEAEPPAGVRNGFASLVRDEVGRLLTFPSVRLRLTGDEILAGEMEIAAVTTGGPIDRVELVLDGEKIARDATPPYVMIVDLGPTPRPGILEAVARDRAGREIARDRAEINQGSARLAVRLLEPRRNRPSDRVVVEVAVPSKERLDRIELYLDDDLFATLRAATLGGPPYTHPFPADAPTAVFLRAVAHLASGATAEDIVFLDARHLEEIDVDLVELYTSVLGPRGRPVLGLGVDDFRVLEDGEPQDILRFDTLENLPIHVTLLMDVSQSMRDRLHIATQSAVRFFEQVVRPKDRASLMTFNHDIRREMGFTHDVDRLRAASRGLAAWGSTRLYDAVVYAVQGFAGREGKKALILLSDGEDVDSDYHFRQVLENALRSRVTVYPIGLDLRHPETRLHLERLAEETGGRFFAAQSASALGDVYRRIEQDLRSQYLLVYRPPDTPRSQFRKVDVEVAGDDRRARTMEGYYP